MFKQNKKVNKLISRNEKNRSLELKTHMYIIMYIQRNFRKEKQYYLVSTTVVSAGIHTKSGDITNRKTWATLSLSLSYECVCLKVQAETSDMQHYT